MPKSGWANQEMRRVAKEVKTLPRWVEKSAKATAASSPQPAKNVQQHAA